ncbi:MAG: GNAT family N-acetyltransferase, partial [Lachnospiraceae bacterium]|nr:GNAT family N-acetyltransferase [Lachnospiraceae bacterium]
EKEKLFLWCNDPECRNNSLQTHIITYSEHCAWFDRKIADPNCYMYIAKIDNQDVGQVRVEVCDEKGIISYSVAKEFRGQGMGKMMLHLLEQQRDIEEKVKCLAATVKKQNVGSIRCFTALGYQEKHDQDMCYFIKNI